MSEAHVALTLRAAHVAASALRALAFFRPLLGLPNGEVSGFEDALEGLRALYRPPKPRHVRPKRPPKPRVATRDARPAVRPVAPLPELVEREEPEEDLEVDLGAEASRCQALLMEIIRRAAHDYVLYRQHRKLELKQLAEQAYIWLFEEEPGHMAWKSRERALFEVKDGSGQPLIEVGSRRLTSFLSICEACSLDPEAVRARAREMTVESIMRTGRHIERRKPRSQGDAMSIETHSVVVDIDMESLDAENQTGSYDYYDSRDNNYGADNSW